MDSHNSTLKLVTARSVSFLRLLGMNHSHTQSQRERERDTNRAKYVFSFFQSVRKRERLFKSRRQGNPIIVHILYLCLIRIFFFLSILKLGAFPFLSFLLRSFQLSAASSLCNHRVFRSIPSLLDSHKFTDRLSLIPW